MLDRRQFVTAGLGVAASATLLAGCSGGAGGGSGSASGEAAGKVYYLNFKPEQDAQWQELAEVYTEETGVPVTVKTAASGQYETTLKSEMSKFPRPRPCSRSTAPWASPPGLITAMTSTTPTSMKTLTNDAYALQGRGRQDQGASPTFIESYGIIYNKELLEKAGYTPEDDITNFETLKSVAEDITARKDELGSLFRLRLPPAWTVPLTGASRPTWPILPIYYEYKDEGIDPNTDAIKGHLSCRPVPPDLGPLHQQRHLRPSAFSSTKTADDATAEFVTGQCVFYQNGTWEYANIAEVGWTTTSSVCCPSTSALTAKRTRASARAPRTTGA